MISLDYKIIILIIVVIVILVGFIFASCKVASMSDSETLEKKQINKLGLNKRQSRQTQKIVRKINEIIDYINGGQL